MSCICTPTRYLHTLPRLLPDVSSAARQRLEAPHPRNPNINKTHLGLEELREGCSRQEATTSVHVEHHLAGGHSTVTAQSHYRHGAAQPQCQSQHYRSTDAAQQQSTAFTSVSKAENLKLKRCRASPRSLRCDRKPRIGPCSGSGRSRSSAWTPPLPPAPGVTSP